MNRLCGTHLLADAMPFATLDPTTRKLDLPGGHSVFLTDTVGFIRKLPTHLVAAFRSTLEEVTLADLILHVVDVSSEDWEVQRDTVIDTLQELGAQDIPTLTVFNKVDLLDDPTLARRLVAEWEGSVAVSALDGTGIPDLVEMMSKRAQTRLGLIRAQVPYDQSALVEACYRIGRVRSCEYGEQGILLEAELTHELRSRLAPYEVKPIPTP
jgi:GTP-binding protein HflX